MTDDLTALFATIVGTDCCLISAEDCEPYTSDFRGIFIGKALAVLLPHSSEQIQAIVRLARKHRLAVVPQGGNTGLAGAATPDNGGRAIVVSLRRMDKIRGIDPLNNTISVEAGCILANVQAAADAHDRLFPLSLGAEGTCTIGGNLATNAGGVNVLRYGMARDLALGIEAVLPDGRLFSDMKSLRKDNTGYDLKQLLIGSEGTLGIITAAVLKLFPKPRQQATAVAALSSLEAAPALLARCRQQAADLLVSYELLPRLGFDLARLAYPQLPKPMPTIPDYSALIALASSSDRIDLSQLLEQCLSDALGAGEISDAVLAQSEAQSLDFWRWREGMVEGQHRRGPGIKHDIAVPVARIPDFIRRADQVMADRYPHLEALAFGHLGDGNVHYNLLQMRETSAEELKSVTAGVNAVVHDIAMELNGSISAEHGIGQLRRQEFATRVDSVEISLMRGIKALLDPDGIMNPGKLL